MRSLLLAATLAAVVTIWCPQAVADVKVYKLTWENDTFQSFGRSDRAYTNGIRYSVTNYGVNEAARPRVWVRALSSSIMPWVNGAQASGWAIGQNMYTPSDISINPPDPSDRPYGGVLYFGLTNTVGGTTLGLDDTHRFEIDVGVIGPPSLAEQSQKIVHRLIGAQRPRGWDYQIESRFAASFLYDWDVKLLGPRSGPFSAELMVNAGTVLGNVIADVHAGATVRIGLNMYPIWPGRIRPTYDAPYLGGGVGEPDDMTGSPGGSGNALWNVVKPNELYLWASVNGKEWLGNVFIDDGLPSIKREFLIGDMAWGAVVGLFRRWEVSYQQVFRSHEFETQSDNNSFGSVGIAYLRGLK